MPETVHYVCAGGQVSWVLESRPSAPLAFDAAVYTVAQVDKPTAEALVVRHHYLHRKPSNAYSFGLFRDGDVVGAVVFGVPASRHLQQSVCPSDPDVVLELNRLWCDDSCPRNTESFFVARALRMLPPRLIVSYADTAWGHTGIVYRALGFQYAGWTDMERKTARYDYIAPEGKHTRDSFRGGVAQWTHRVRRKPKAKYWTATGDRRERARLTRLCAWHSLDWREFPVPDEHRQLRLPKKAA